MKHQYEDLLKGTLHEQKYVLHIMNKNLENFGKILGNSSRQIIIPE